MCCHVLWHLIVFTDDIYTVGAKIHFAKILPLLLVEVYSIQLFTAPITHPTDNQALKLTHLVLLVVTFREIYV